MLPMLFRRSHMPCVPGSRHSGTETLKRQAVDAPNPNPNLKVKVTKVEKEGSRKTKNRKVVTETKNFEVDEVEI